MSTVTDIDREAPLLSVNGLSRRYGAGCEYCADHDAVLERNYCPRCGTVHALRDVSLDVYPGEIVGIVGESGSGKSTLMQCICFDQEASAGSVTTALVEEGETNLLGVSPQHKRFIRNTIFGMVYQNPWLGLRMDFSALSNIAEQMIASGNRNVGEMRKRAYHLLEQVNIPARRAVDPP
ncbi:MAG TPA: phosphonate C-P lyase system protein PhnK, partial [Coriobacteriia bacterium]|nr:phosphonate C-P lyase system protein PhnK [Coriobacteriia bacterium]